ncbi:MAG: hypothetical protein ABI347_01405 [Nitrososphaera sp.]
MPYEPVPSAFHNFVFDVQYETTVVGQRIIEGSVESHEPLGVFVWMNAIIMLLTSVGVWW